MLGGPLQLLWGPAIYMILAALGLNQFKVSTAAFHVRPPCRRLPGRQLPAGSCVSPVQIIYHLLARFLSQSSSNPVWQAVQPAFRQQLTFFESIFGKPATFSPTVTHVRACHSCSLAGMRMHFCTPMSVVLCCRSCWWPSCLS